MIIFQISILFHFHNIENKNDTHGIAIYQKNNWVVSKFDINVNNYLKKFKILKFVYGCRSPMYRVSNHVCPILHT